MTKLEIFRFLFSSPQFIQYKEEGLHQHLLDNNRVSGACIFVLIILNHRPQSLEWIILSNREVEAICFCNYPIWHTFIGIREHGTLVRTISTGGMQEKSNVSWKQHHNTKCILILGRYGPVQSHRWDSDCLDPKFSNESFRLRARLVLLLWV